MKSFTVCLLFLTTLTLTSATPVDIDIKCSTKYCMEYSGALADCAKVNGVDKTLTEEELKGESYKKYLQCACESSDTLSLYNQCTNCYSDPKSNEIVRGREFLCSTGTSSDDSDDSGDDTDSGSDNTKDEKDTSTSENSKNDAGALYFNKAMAGMVIAGGVIAAL